MEVGEEKADKRTKEKQLACCSSCRHFLTDFSLLYGGDGVLFKMGFFLKSVLVLLIKG
jgi:hypothetical protein